MYFNFDAIETALLQKLPAMLSRTRVNNLAATELHAIFGEDGEGQAQRDELASKIATLQLVLDDLQRF